MRTALAQVALVAASILVGCGSPDSDAPAPREPRQVTSALGDTASVAAGNNAFAWDLYKQASGEPGNVFVSPFSVAAALGLVYSGAAGETARQMHDALHVGLPDSSWHTAFGALMRDLGGAHQGRGYQLLIANALFGQQGFAFSDAYLSRTSTDYGAGLTPADFARDAEGARGEVNGWVAQQTQGTIPDLIPSGGVDSSTVLVAANAIYFKASWATAFDPARTGPGPFQRDDGTTVQTPMMYGDGEKAHFSAGGDDRATAFELPYLDDEISMVIVVPKDAGSIAAFEGATTAADVESLFASLKPTRMDVVMPKWTSRFSLPLVEALQGLGVADAFDAGKADLSGIATGAQLYVSGAWHKTYVEVDERGTTAAAATGMGVSLASAPPTFRADRSFLYLIRDRLTGSILFIGRVADPTAS